MAAKPPSSRVASLVTAAESSAIAASVRVSSTTACGSIRPIAARTLGTIAVGSPLARMNSVVDGFIIASRNGGQETYRRSRDQEVK